MKAISRSSRLVAALAATTGLLLAGCSTGAGQPNAAAILGDKVIPVSLVQQKLDTAVSLRPEFQQQRDQNKLDSGSRGILSMLIWQDLAARLIEREGLSVSESAVDQLPAKFGPTLPAKSFPVYDMQGLRDYLRAQLQIEAVGKKYAAKTSVTFDAVFATSRAEAETKAKQMAKGPAAVRQLVQSETAAKQQAALGATLFFAQAKANYAVSPLFGTLAGEIVAFPLSEDSGQLEQQSTPTAQWMVVYVHKRDNNTKVAADPANPAAGQQTEEGLAQLYFPHGLQVMSLFAEEIGMQINPRYGKWDPVLNQLAASTGEQAGFRLKAAAAPAKP